MPHASLQPLSPCCSAAAVVGREAVLSLKPARLQASELRPIADITGWLRQREESRGEFFADWSRQNSAGTVTHTSSCPYFKKPQRLQSKHASWTI